MAGSIPPEITSKLRSLGDLDYPKSSVMHAGRLRVRRTAETQPEDRYSCGTSSVCTVAIGSRRAACKKRKLKVNGATRHHIY